MKKVYNLDTINRFKRFKDTFASNKNATNCKIFNFLKSTNNNFEDLIKIDNNREKIK